MLSRAVLRLAKSSKMSIVPRRKLHETLNEYGPPAVHVSGPELWALVSFIMVGMLGPSMYLLLNFQEYNGKAAERRAAAAAKK